MCYWGGFWVVINTGAEADSGVTNTESSRGFRREKACEKRGFLFLELGSVTLSVKETCFNQ